MKKIVMDLEFCRIDEKNNPCERKKLRYEVIQIGAVKLNENNDIVDEFDELVKPQYAVITPDITKLTHITSGMVEHELDFNTVMEKFLSWIGSDEFKIFTWSMTDREQIKYESKMKQYKCSELEYIYDRWYDLQRMFCDKLGVKQQVSLTNALKAGDIEFEGIAHSACDDAKNTARVYKIMEDESLFEKKYSAMVDIFRPKEELTVSLSSLLEGIKLEGLSIA